MNIQNKLCQFFIYISFGILSISNAFAIDGQQLFMDKCASCHTVTSQKTTGPGLKGVLERHPKEWLYSWIRNSQDMVTKGDPAAVALFAEYKQVVMTPFPSLTNEDIDAILDFIAKGKPAPEPKPEDENANVSKAAGQVKEWTALSEGFNSLTMIPLIILTVFLVVMYFAAVKVPGYPD